MTEGNVLFVVLVKDKTSDREWFPLCPCKTYNEAEEVIDYHHSSYACFKIERIYKGAKYEA